MNSLMSTMKTAAASAAVTGDNKKTDADQPSNTDIMSSAKLVAEAAQCAATNQTEKIDKAKVAGATADLLDSVKEHGKFDESRGVGQYIKQADEYLHQYEKSGATAAPPAVEEKKAEIPAVEAEKKAEAPPAEEEKGVKDEAAIAGDALKAAGGLFK